MPQKPCSNGFGLSDEDFLKKQIAYAKSIGIEKADDPEFINSEIKRMSALLAAAFGGPKAATGKTAS